MRKIYVISYGKGDLVNYHENGGYDAMAEVTNALRKYIVPVSNDDLTELGKSYGLDGPYHKPNDKLGFTRRSAARHAVAKLIAGDYHCRGKEEGFFRVIEVGTFDREVRPVKHWNIERQYRSVRNGVTLAWSDPVVWGTGISVRAKARDLAAHLTTTHNAASAEFGEEFKFRAVPVYAEVK